MSAFTAIAAVLAIIVTASNAAPYSKYGRSCKDIGCRSDEVCVMAEDPCGGYQRDSCGRYPTCQRTSSGGESCTTKMCPTGQYCKTENGKPTCVNTTPGLAPAARKPPGYDRRVTPRPVIPTPPPRSSSYDNRFSGYSGNRNTVGNNSIWDRLFGGGGSSGSRTRAGGSSGLSDYGRLTPRPATNVYPGGKDYYTSHTSVDSKGNRVWTFSG